MSSAGQIPDGLRLLVVEDEALIAEEIKDRLERLGADVIGLADNAAAAIDIARRLQPDLVLMDIRLKGPSDGVEAAARIYREHSIPVVFLTAHSDQATLDRALKATPFGYVLKPFQQRELVVAIEMAIHRHRIEHGLREAQLTHQAILAGIGEGVIAFDQRRRIQYMNRQAEALTGWDSGEVIGRPVEEIVCLKDASGVALAERDFNPSAGAGLPSGGRGYSLAGRDGAETPVDASIADIEIDGTRVGTALTLRNVRESRLQETARSRLASLVEAASDAIVGVDPGGTVRIWNPAAQALLGYRADEVVGQPLSVLAAPGDGGELERSVATVLAGGRMELTDTYRRRKDGTLANVWISVSPIRDASERIIGASGIIRDISQRKRADQALRETQERLAVFIDHAPAALAMLDEGMRYIAASRRWSEDYGLGERDLTGLSHYEVFPDLPDYWKRIHRRALEGEVQRGAEDRYERPGFPVQWISWEARPWHTADGRVGGILLFNEDVTDRKLARERILDLNTELERRVEARTSELQESRDYQRLLFETSPVGLALCDLDGGLVDVNPAFLHIVGYTEEEVKRLTYWDLTPKEYESDEQRQLDSLKRTGRYGEYVKEYRRKDGRLVPVRLNGLLITRGERQYIWSSVEDITERRSAEREMMEARRLAEESARAKADFLANMSHEIRTPLNAVLGLARIGARDCAGTPAQAKFSGIVDAGQHLLGVINDVLDISRLEAGKVAVLDQPYSLGKLLTEAHGFVASAARQKGLACTIHLSRDMPDWIRGDAQRVRQILLNLLSNAVKFTERGSVRLNVDRDGSDIVFVVADTGIGLTGEEASRLFTAFEQADRSTTRRFGGSGLGLAISRNLARLMGGDIAVASSPGSGSRFTLRLPLHAAERSAHRQPAPGAGDARLRGIRILAAEDVEINRIVLADLLGHEGASVTMVENGAEAVAWLGAGRAGEVDVVLMDIQMPEMDGYEATRRIHQLAPALPVIGLTAHALAEERQRCFAAGMVDHITKPIEPATLVASILKNVDAAVIQRAARPAAPAACAVCSEGPALPPPGQIDWCAMYRRFGGQKVFVGRLVAVVLSTQAGVPESLRTSVSRRDLGAVAFAAHSLKSVVGNLEAKRLYELAQRTELQARAGADEALELASELAAGFEAMLAEISRSGLSGEPAGAARTDQAGCSVTRVRAGA